MLCSCISLHNFCGWRMMTTIRFAGHPICTMDELLLLLLTKVPCKISRVKFYEQKQQKILTEFQKAHKSEREGNVVIQHTHTHIHTHWYAYDRQRLWLAYVSQSVAVVPRSPLIPPYHTYSYKDGGLLLRCTHVRSLFCHGLWLVRFVKKWSPIHREKSSNVTQHPINLR